MLHCHPFQPVFRFQLTKCLNTFQQRHGVGCRVLAKVLPRVRRSDSSIQFHRSLLIRANTKRLRQISEKTNTSNSVVNHQVGCCQRCRFQGPCGVRSISRTALALLEAADIEALVSQPRLCSFNRLFSMTLKGRTSSSDEITPGVARVITPHKGNGNSSSGVESLPHP